MHRNLWAPWRLAYLEELEHRAETLASRASGAAVTEGDSDFLAAYWSTPDDDERNLVVHRNAHGIILLNRFPYANGHLLVALGDARPTLREYEPQQRAEFWKLVDLATELIERTLRPQGVNIGVNIGRAAGAGLPQHAHAHVVPRWAGDTNFLSVIGEVRLIPETLESMAEKFRRALAHAPNWE